MPRLSLWKDGRHSNDYKFIDRRISEMFTIGGLGIFLHKYLGTNEQNTVKTTSAAQSAVGHTLTFADTTGVALGAFVTGTGIPTGSYVSAKTATSITLNTSTTTALASGSSVSFYTNQSKPSYTNQSALNIQDLLFLENRDRKYDVNVYQIRGVYQASDAAFDLSQFGLFLQTGTLFMVFHINDMIDFLGRKIMNGDVIELPHLKDYNPLDTTLPVALKRYYVVSDAMNAAEGFSPTWWPHLWRVKLNPLTDSQEFKDILNQIKVDADPNDPTNGNITLGSISSIIGKYQQANDAIIAEAEKNVPYSGYDISKFYIKPSTTSLTPGDPLGITTDSGNVTADGGVITSDASVLSPDATIHGYLTGSGSTPNGLPVATGISFPLNPQVGDYALRTDYLPNRLFRWDGRRWVKIEDNVRTSLTPGADNKTLRSSFVNDTNTFTNNAGTHEERQSLSKALRPEADN
ncbi:hypothetical protein UFOVP257_26 [uncultured Caudovirales phage]|uniref:Uncharacterized protein n=1 Tax=uncultured Caudovirales phage TaxID=2100421 RepID=A0A6J5LE70_9CAUD|nr:hypothetical protein UFOVP257_26 [uncultured Caudovirales phage]